ncbi:MAG: WHG domain-containing protein [Alphaproteobacteria bacterium]
MARRSDHSLEEKRALALAAVRELAEEGGLRAITARAVADRMGYAVGTIYNIYGNLDELVARANAETLDALYDDLSAGSLGRAAHDRLRELARRYVAFIARHPGRWSAVIEAPSVAELPIAEWYGEKVERLLRLAEDAIASFFPAGEEAARAEHARVLWSALHGITIIAMQGGKHRNDTIEAQIETLIRTYLAGLAAPRRA